ncbi:hypothetical protein QYM36_001444 [Artemia franciscana]|uniref:Uncharacterized protein n=1 Tax=Artemia franciscana TaxID=6661 RepID=A0AA88LB74_ARTSF|nr:hypothetical protein QYM36_001444 [Artemia franciscana]
MSPPLDKPPHFCVTRLRLVNANEKVITYLAEAQDTIVDVAPFPFPRLHELREKYTYSLTQWSQSVVLVAKKGLRLIYSDDDDSDSEVKEITVATAFGLGNMK